MGMTMSLYGVSDATLQRLVADPPLVWRLVMPDDDELEARARAESSRASRGWWSRLFGRTEPGPTSSVSETLELDAAEGFVASLDKSWHGLHYLLTGGDRAGTPPLDFLLEGGVAIGSVDLGYGPARGFAALEVRGIATELAALSDAELLGRYDGAAMTARGVYLDIWDRPTGEGKEYLAAHLDALRSAIQTIVGRGHGILLVLS